MRRRTRALSGAPRPVRTGFADLFGAALFAPKQVQATSPVTAGKKTSEKRGETCQHYMRAAPKGGAPRASAFRSSPGFPVRLSQATAEETQQRLAFAGFSLFAASTAAAIENELNDQPQKRRQQADPVQHD